MKKQIALNTIFTNQTAVNKDHLEEEEEKLCPKNSLNFQSLRKLWCLGRKWIEGKQPDECELKFEKERRFLRLCKKF